MEASRNIVLDIAKEGSYCGKTSVPGGNAVLPAVLYMIQKRQNQVGRSEEHTSELQSLMRISYAVFCLKKKKTTIDTDNIITNQTQTHILHHSIIIKNNTRYTD